MPTPIASESFIVQTTVAAAARLLLGYAERSLPDYGAIWKPADEFGPDLVCLWPQTLGTGQLMRLTRSIHARVNPEATALVCTLLPVDPNAPRTELTLRCFDEGAAEDFTAFAAWIRQLWEPVGARESAPAPQAPPIPWPAPAAALTLPVAPTLNPGGRPSKRDEHKEWYRLWCDGTTYPDIHRAYPRVKQTTIERRVRELLAEERRKPGENL